MLSAEQLSSVNERTNMKKVMLVIRDGWGYSTRKSGNAILNADTPFDDSLAAQSPWAMLTCHGEKVGLPHGFQGSSEVGHLNMGAGRIVVQEVTRIFEAITQGELFRTDRFGEIRTLLRSGKSRLHLTGLLQDEGVHAHQEHLFALYRAFRSEFPDLKIWIHPIADGRDTPPKSFLTFFRTLKAVIATDPLTQIGTIWGRYYGMDRSRSWPLIRLAVDALVNGEGQRTADFEQAVMNAYATELTPDNVPMVDEYLKPLVATDYPGMLAGDVVINFNYRQDRAIQISQAFTSPECPAFLPECGKLHYYGLTRYYNEFHNFLMPPMDDAGGMENILGAVLSDHGKRQLRIAETQKFRHVTSFFNGKSTQPYPLEDQVEIHGEFDPSSFASHPGMNAEDVTQELLARMDSGYDFIAVNYANCDMVGHTGDYDAAVRAVEIVDGNVARITRAAVDSGYAVLVTADHGNAEEMLDESGAVKTAHTTNPVRLYLVNAGHFESKAPVEGILSDIAPLVLRLMDLPIPAEMTSRELADRLIC